MTGAELEVLAVDRWPTNAHLIEHVAHLGYLRADARTLDPTYGRGVFWRRWRPDELVAHDLKLDGVDFRNLPHADGEFAATVFDPPYKLNGRPTADVDEPYGVDVPDTIAGRHELMRLGLIECARVTAHRGRLLVKCQNQVASGRVWWQTDLVTGWAAELAPDLELVKLDEFHRIGMRKQPPGRRQVHARRNYSTLIVLEVRR